MSTRGNPPETEPVSAALGELGRWAQLPRVGSRPSSWSSSRSRMRRPSSGSRPTSRQRSSSSRWASMTARRSRSAGLVLRRQRDLAGLGVVQQVQPVPVAVQPGAQLRPERGDRLVVDVVVLLGLHARRAGAAPPRPRRCGPRCAAAPGRPRRRAAQRPHQRGEGEPLADEGDQHGEEGAEQQQVAVGERGAVVGDQRQREDRGQADDAAGAGPAQHDDLPAGQPAAASVAPSAVVRSPSPSRSWSASRVCSACGSVLGEPQPQRPEQQHARRR